MKASHKALCLHAPEGFELHPSLPFDCCIDVLAGVHNACQRHHNPHAVDDHEVEPEVQELWPGVTLKACMSAQSRGVSELYDDIRDAQARLGGEVAQWWGATALGWWIETNDAGDLLHCKPVTSQNRCTPVAVPIGGDAVELWCVVAEVHCGDRSCALCRTSMQARAKVQHVAIQLPQ